MHSTLTILLPPTLHAPFSWVYLFALLTFALVGLHALGRAPWKVVVEVLTELTVRALCVVGTFALAVDLQHRQRCHELHAGISLVTKMYENKLHMLKLVYTHLMALWLYILRVA